MKQHLITGSIFLGGLILGSIISAYRSGYHTTKVSENIPEVVRGLSGTDPLNAAFVSNMTRELMHLRQTVNELKALKNNTVVYVKQEPQSHEDVAKLDKSSASLKPVTFSDGHSHKDDARVATELHDKVRVLCWIMTSAGNLQSKAIHVKNSWGKRCNKLLFMSDVEDKDFPAVGLGTEVGRNHLTAKTMRAFDYVYKHHLNDADWFMKADDDTYVIVENLRYMLSAHAPTEAVFFGHHFKVIVKQGYFSGGAGYVFSKEALQRFAKRDTTTCRQDGGSEDAEMGHCMERLGVKTGDSRDNLGKSRFHCFNPETHLHGGYPDWYRQYDKYGAQMGIQSMSDYAVSFHYVTTNQMYDLEYYVYHLSAYGVVQGLQDLNGPVKESNKTTSTTAATTTTTTTTTPVPKIASKQNAAPNNMQ